MNWPAVPLAECPVGLFVYNHNLCLKTEYYTQGSPDAYIVMSGEYFWGGTDNRKERDKLMVQPIRVCTIAPARR